MRNGGGCARELSDIEPYIAPRELAIRWQCSRTSVDRITRRAGLTRVCLGDGVNGMIRYLRKEIEEYEQSRQIKGCE